MKNERTKAGNKGSFFRSVKGKTLFMGMLGILAALVIGLVGVISINRNAQNSEVVSLVDEINVLQAQNTANDALYQYYVDETYLNAIISNLDEMEQKAGQLKDKADISYSGSVDSILDNLSSIKANFDEIVSINADRGYDSSVGKYKAFLDSSQELSASFGSLVNNNDWVEIPWTDTTFGVDDNFVMVDGKQYALLQYDHTLPVVGKRNNLAMRVGGTFTYQGDYYIKNIQLVNGSDVANVDLTPLETMEKSGDGLGGAEFADFGGEKAIKVTGNYNADLNRWEEVSITISIQDYDLNNYPDLHYDLYIDPEAIAPDSVYKFGGAVSGVYGFGSKLTDLDSMVAAYSKLVVEGKDVTSNLSEIEALFAELSDNIPKYTTDPSLAENSAALLNAKKEIFDQLKSTDQRTLALKADNVTINAKLSGLCESVQSDAIANMNAVRSSVTVIIFAVLFISVAVLVLILLRISLGINKSVNSFSSAIEEIASGKLSTRADDSGRDEFATFATSLNSFMDVLENTISKVISASDVLSDSGELLEETANKTKVVAGEINTTIGEISKGAGEQAGDIETSSQQIVDIRNNIQSILDSVSALSEKTTEMGRQGKESTSNMEKLTRSSDLTTEAFGRIVEQVNKTDESVGKIQDAVSLISSVANQINLLSLNASIEAARAGEAGKGFAVVASEISNLADQTNESTTIIEGIIKGLSEESNKTVATINEVTEMIEDQKNSIDATNVIFESVSTGIEYTSDAVDAVLGQARSCERSGESMVDLMTNLSAISQENAASAETTSTAMTKLNEETVKLADTSAELKKLADNLKEDLKFFEL